MQCWDVTIYNVQSIDEVVEDGHTLKVNYLIEIN